MSERRFPIPYASVGKILAIIVALAAVSALLGFDIVQPEYQWELLLYIGGLLVFSVILLFSYQHHQRRMRANIHRMAEGELGIHIETKGLKGAALIEAEELNRINDAVKDAVEERIRSEQLKTELVTNVTHDIKTPLTSIINYVDLLKRSDSVEGHELSEDQREYLMVLEKQSVRLKKLIEDLIDASKASTGNVTIDLTVLDLKELLEQICGEYTDRFEQKQLTVVKELPAEEVLAVADGEHLFRVLDNVFSNVEKYSMPGTKVLLKVLLPDKEEVPDSALGRTSFATDALQIIVENESALPLEKTGEELTNRFVRGDISRHSEGSGLGLAIAKSLTELMGGRFSVETQGDRFILRIALRRA